MNKPSLTHSKLLEISRLQQEIRDIQNTCRHDNHISQTKANVNRFYVKEYFMVHECKDCGFIWTEEMK